jgi:hypothetical protein
VAICGPRLVALDRFITADEHKWATRSANYYYALRHGEYASTYQREHPGVTIMWAGAAGLLWCFPEYGVVGKAQASVGEYEGILAEHGCKMVDLLASARFCMVVAHTIVLLLAFLYARRTLGLVPAFLGVLFIAFNPFHVAHSRLLHLDGLLSSLLLLALLAFLSYLSGRRFSALVVSGIATGLAGLTKSPAVLLAPAVGLLALVALGQRLWGRQDTRPERLVWQALWPLLVWGCIAVAVLVLLWPAMWVDPVGTLTKMASSALAYAEEGHGGPVYFNGQVASDGNLGLALYHFYPTTYLWRSTPAILAGLLAATVTAVLRSKPLAQPIARRTVLGLMLFVLVFGVAMTLGEKKFDRYLLAAYPPLDLVAAAGWVALAHRLGQLRSPVLRWGTVPVLLSVAVVAQAAVTLGTAPYYLSYYNPLMGGSHKAPEVMMIGWGEGLDEAARYLNAKDEASELTVASWYRRPFASYFSGTSRRIPLGSELDEAQLQKVLGSDYVVVYIHQWQRQAPRQVLERLAPLTPEHVVTIDGLEYARIYRPPASAAPSSILFEADVEMLSTGRCTWLRWEVDNVRAVYVDGQGVVGHDEQLVCPSATMVHQLKVIHSDGSETVETVEVELVDAPQG